MGIKVSVTGSRSITDENIVFKILTSINDRYSIELTIHGGAIGVDSIAEKFCNKNNISTKIIIPEWEKLGKKAGMVRNTLIINEADLVVAIYDGNSKGTKNAIDMAIRNKKNIMTFDSNGKLNNKYCRSIREVGYEYEWSRVVKRGEPYFECSSKGNKHYSALYAMLDGKSIEEIYQLDIKGYRGKVDHWVKAKGKPPLNKLTEDELYNKYIKLWQTYFKQHDDLYINILEKAKGKTITDMFGVRPINQARAICDICNNGYIF